MSSNLQHLLSRFDAERPLARASTIPAAWYHDPALADLERQVVFGDSWIAVGRADQVAEPGSFFTIDLAGEPLVILRDNAGDLRAFFNVCRHRGAKIALEDQGHCSRLRCRYHGWTYDLTGRLIGTPEFEGTQDFQREDNPLPALAVAQRGSLIWVHAGQQPPAIDAWLAPLTRRGLDRLMAPLKFAARRTYPVACNWKVYVDNYLDGGYHVNTVHPALAGVLDYSRYRTEIDEHASVQISPLEKNVGDDVSVVRAGDNAYYAWIFPNFMVNIYDGVMDTNLVLPEGPNACRVVFDFFFADIESERAKAYMARSMEVANQVQIEDESVCMDVQQGLKSRSYDVGRFSVKREAGGYHFHQLLARKLRQGLPSSPQKGECV